MSQFQPGDMIGHRPCTGCVVLGRAGLVTLKVTKNLKIWGSCEGGPDGSLPHCGHREYYGQGPSTALKRQAIEASRAPAATATETEHGPDPEHEADEPEARPEPEPERRSSAGVGFFD